MTPEVTPLQAWIQTTQATLDGATATTGRPRISPPRPACSGAARPQRLLAAATRLAERLGELAVGDQDRVDWFGIKMVDEDRWSIAPLNGSLYDGAGGLALFFAHLAALTDDADARFLAEAALSIVDRTRDTTTRLPGLIGLAGVVHVYTHLGLLWDRPQLLATAEELCLEIPDQCREDLRLDLMGGAAGNLLAAAGLARATQSKAALAAARAAGEQLLANAVPQAKGVAWITDLCPRALGGFSHGAAGMAAALLELHSLTGDARVLATARGAIEYERALYEPTLRNWLDLRFDQASPRTMNAWCHGAPGIGMMRLRWRGQLDDRASAEIEIAARACLDDDLGTSHTLCHGSVGNILLPWEWSRVAGAHAAQVGVAVDTILDSLEQGVVCGSLPGAEVPGMFIGLAGIGLGLLRMAAPERVPCPLTMRLPG